jgi:hypothetical protein
LAEKAQWKRQKSCCIAAIFAALTKQIEKKCSNQPLLHDMKAAATTTKLEHEH